MIKNLRLQYIFALIFSVTSISFWLLHTTRKEDKIEADKNRIIKNLTSVEDALRQRQKQNLSTQQHANRIIALDILKEYIEVARFPKNNQISTRTPIFKDNEGTWCAVGYMLASTGYQQLAEKINSINTFVYIDEIEDFESQSIGKWAKTYGFDQAELAMIQPGYGPISFLLVMLIHGTVTILTPVERLFFHHNTPS